MATAITTSHKKPADNLASVELSKPKTETKQEQVVDTQLDGLEAHSAPKQNTALSSFLAASESLQAKIEVSKQEKPATKQNIKAKKPAGLFNRIIAMLKSSTNILDDIMDAIANVIKNIVDRAFGKTPEVHQSKQTQILTEEEKEQEEELIRRLMQERQERKVSHHFDDQ